MRFLPNNECILSVALSLESIVFLCNLLCENAGSFINA